MLNNHEHSLTRTLPWLAWTRDTSSESIYIDGSYRRFLMEHNCSITPYMSLHDMTASEVVTKLRTEVEARTGLTISAGIAPNTMLAKICSDKNKPNGQYELEFQGKAIRQFMSDLPIRRIPGIGRVAERYAKALGVNVCGDIYQHRGVINLMDRHVGFKFMM